MKRTRIPKLTAVTTSTAKSWFKTMQARGLMFHPDDSPKDVVQISDGKRSFSDSECIEVKRHIDQLFIALGDMVYDVAFDVVSEGFHTSAERREIAFSCA